MESLQAHEGQFIVECTEHVLWTESVPNLMSSLSRLVRATVAVLGLISGLCRKHGPKSTSGGENTSLGSTPQPCRDMGMIGPFTTY